MFVYVIYGLLPEIKDMMMMMMMMHDIRYISDKIFMKIDQTDRLTVAGDGNKMPIAVHWRWSFCL